MSERRNKFIELALQDAPAFGGIAPCGDLGRMRSLGDSSFDFALIDMEHEGFDFPHLGDSLQWLMSRRRMVCSGAMFPSPTPIVRLPHAAGEQVRWIATQALDYGALGIVLPYTETVEEVERMVEALRYPQPDGHGGTVGSRGVWPKLAARYWGCANYDEYMEMANLWPLVPNGELVLIAMVATQTAFQNIDEIAGVPGLGGVLFGAKHAWSALGRRGQTDLEHRDLVAFRSRVLAACQKADILAGASLSATPPGGVATVDLTFLQRRIEEGFRFFLSQGEGRPVLG